jgi:hypothetical protein
MSQKLYKKKKSSGEAPQGCRAEKEDKCGGFSFDRKRSSEAGARTRLDDERTA